MVRRTLAAWPALFVWLAVFVAACGAPAYDATTDKQIADLQRDVDAGLVNLITIANRIDALKNLKDPASVKALADARGKAGYNANIAFYDKVDTDLTSLQLRMTATPDLSAAPLDRLFTSIRDNFNDLRQQHAKLDFIGTAALTIIRSAINQQFKTLMQYELNLKSGKPATGT